MQTSPHAYDAILSRVQHPARYLGNERGAIRKHPTAGMLRFALAFPDVYEIAQSHPGLQLLYDLLNRRTDVYAERVYAPWFDMEAELRRAGVPLASLETFTPLHAFDVIGFTLQYELTYTNLIAMLELGGVPPLARERRADAPLVIAGGPCAFNPEPLAEFLDAVVLGDGEFVIHQLCDVVQRWDGGDRTDLLEQLTAIRGVYVPAFFQPEYDGRSRLRRMRALRPGYECVEKAVVPDLNAVPLQDTYVVPALKTVHDRPSLEVMRGCVKGCRFCQAGYIYRPLRERDPRRVIEQAERAVARTGCDEVSLLSLSTGDYSCVNPLLTELMNRLAEKQIAVSLPSTRVDALSPALLDQIKRVRKTGFTLAPEAGSQRLRDVIQKEYREEELIAAAQQIFALGWSSLKLYFMLGLPSETEDDLRGIVDLSAKVARTGGSHRTVTASVSNFVPKPHTPFQWMVQLPIAEMEDRQRFLRRELARRKVAFRWHDARLSWLEGIIARGDRRIGALLLRATQLGCRFDGWTDVCRLDLWERALADTGIDANDYLRRRTLDEVLPWDHLRSGVTKTFLQRELARAFEGTLTPDCSVERCTYCGACDFQTIRNVDYHLHGANGSDHRGAAVDHWASERVDDTGSGSWEPRGWQRVHAPQRAMTRPKPVPPDGSDAASVPPPPAAAGLGNAEEWLSAGDEALRPAAAAPTAAACRLRVTYAKLGRARFIGSYELTMLVQRAIRQAGIPVAFSRGHHPAPRLGFGPALPVGIESLSEHFEIDLTTAGDAGAIRAALQDRMPEGIELTRAELLPLSAPSIGASIAALRFQFDARVLARDGDCGRVQRDVDAFNAAAEFPIRKRQRGKDRVINGRPFVSALTLSGDGLIDATILCGTTGTVKPKDVLGAVLGLQGAALDAVPIRKIDTIMAAAFESRGGA